MTQTELTTRQLAEKFRVTPRWINVAKDRVEKRTGKKVGTPKGNTYYFSVEEQNAIEAELKIGKTDDTRSAQTNQNDRVDQPINDRTNNAVNESGNRITQNMLRTVADKASTELAVQTEKAIVVQTLQKLGNIDDPRLDDTYAALEAVSDLFVANIGNTSHALLMGDDSFLFQPTPEQKYLSGSSVESIEQ